MPDIPGNTSTTATIIVGETLINQLDAFGGAFGDHDWFRIELTAGQKITITLDGITLEDPYLRLRDAFGNLLAENDDINLGLVRDSRLVFTAPTTGTYYIDVGAWDEAYAGTYELSVQLYTPPTVWTYEEVADQLTAGYWGGDVHAFNVTQGGTITVNVTALTTAGQNLARNALALWSDVIGVTFVEVTSGGQITFGDNEPGAFSDGIWSNGTITQTHVNVSTGWLSSYGTSLNSYSFHTYIHEIGHALGLGHAGMYNETANYADDALYLNDSWPVTIMSYFDQSEATYFANQAFTEAFAATPMVADIRAMATLYGLSTTTRTGDTTYGFGNNSGRAVYTASIGTITAYTIFDSGGIDTLNYSGFGNHQVINLNPETFSNVGGGIGNVSIAFNTIIENAIGGSGNDQIYGNSANNVLDGGGGNDILVGGGGNDILIGGPGIDALTGGAGADTFRGTVSWLNGDTITDLQLTDKIILTDANLASFSFNLTGNTLTYTGGSLTLQGSFSGFQLVASAAAGGGVQLALQATVIADVRNDFNGDGRSDILWRHDSGLLTQWLGQANGGFADNGANAFSSVSTAWSVTGIGDFNGDGRDDILWRHDDGYLTEWLGQANGGFADNGANAFASVSTAWDVAGIGDFNGDGRDDILWRHDAGHLTEWLGQANGGFADNGANAFASIATSWSVAGIGDFNGDGRDDILWRHDAGHLTEWLGQANGGFADNGANAFASIATSWHVQPAELLV